MLNIDMTEISDHSDTPQGRSREDAGQQSSEIGLRERKETASAIASRTRQVCSLNALIGHIVSLRDLE